MGEHEVAPKTKKKKRFRRLRWFILPIVLVLAIAGVGGYLLVGAVKINGEIKRIPGLKHLLPSPKHGALKATENILLVGSTDRCALSVQNPAYGLCQDGVDGINSDILMVLHLDPNNGAVSILSIPRDLFIPNARSTGANKVDAGLVEGPDQLIQAVEDDFGIPIQHFAELNFETFATVVNDLGGVKMYFPMPVYDKESGLNITTPGCHDLNGIEALQVVRSRHLHYDPPGSGLSMSDPLDWPQDPLSDLSRIRRTHEFLRVLAAAVSKKGLDNPFTDEDLIGDVASQLQVDPGLTLQSMVNIALTFHAANPYKSIQLTLPVVVDANLAYQYQGYNYGNVEFPDEQLDQQTIDSVLGINASTDSMTGLPLPAATSVKIAVENGTGVNGEGDAAAASLQQLGYSVVSTTDVTPVGPESETLVQYDSKSLEGDAEKVARSLTGAVILSFGPVPAGSQVAVITGSDFGFLAPTTTAPTTSTTAPGTSSSSTSSTTTSTTTATTTPPSSTPTNTGSDELTAPSAASSPLAPFDPRSCTASGGEGP